MEVTLGAVFVATIPEGIDKKAFIAEFESRLNEATLNQMFPGEPDLVIFGEDRNEYGPPAGITEEQRREAEAAQ